MGILNIKSEKKEEKKMTLTNIKKTKKKFMNINKDLKKDFRCSMDKKQEQVVIQITKDLDRIINDIHRFLY